MPIRDALLPEYDQEMATTRKVLDRLPEDKFGWRPHPKSFSMKDLAVHVATIPAWLVETLNRTELDFAPVGGPPYEPPKAESKAELIAMFDKGVTDGRAVLAKASDQDMMTPWTLLAGGNPIFTMPRIACIRGFVMNHMIHHRAQLGVYLRLNDVPVPQMYGPTADEP